MSDTETKKPYHGDKPGFDLGDIREFGEEAADRVKAFGSNVVEKSKELFQGKDDKDKDK